MKSTIACLWWLSLALVTAKNIAFLPTVNLLKNSAYLPADLPDITSRSLPTHQWNVQADDGAASFGYYHPGQASTNFRSFDGSMTGFWTYVNPEGKTVNVTYVADQQGFRVANGVPIGSVSGVVEGLSADETPVDPSAKTKEIPDKETANNDDSDCIGNIPKRLKRQTNDEMNFGVSHGSLYEKSQGLVGMEETAMKEFPFMVALLKFDQTVKRYTLVCGGTLISADKILTAAHCLVDGDDRYPALENFIVKLDVYFLKETADDATITKRISNINVHENFDPVTRYNDIAILTLESPVSGFSPYVSTICLPKDCHKGAHSGYGKILGWGNTKIGERNSERLRQTTVEMIDNKECAKTYNRKKEIADHMICAIGIQDFCRNYDGGPLILDRDGQPGECPWVQMGIVSFGRGCIEMGAPAVYTRLTSFWPWIESQVEVVYKH